MFELLLILALVLFVLGAFTAAKWLIIFALVALVASIAARRAP